LEDIKKDSGKQAYFVFIDMPSNMYIYDEFCRLKPQDEWLDMANLPWIKTNYNKQRRLAYFQQTKCLYGKLEQFINRLKDENLWNDTVMVIQGTSGVNDFQNYKQEDFIKNFISNRLVTMAIHDNQMKESLVDNSFCPTQSILNEYLFNRKCKAENLGVHSSIVANVRAKMSRLTTGINQNKISTFDKWYKDWADYNQDAKPQFDIFKKESKEELFVPEDEENDEMSNEDFGIDDFGIDDLEAEWRQNNDELKGIITK
jgi:hypothetical protein